MLSVTNLDFSRLSDEKTDRPRCDRNQALENIEPTTEHSYWQCLDQLHNDTGSVTANLWRQAILWGHGGAMRQPELANPR